MTSYFIYYRIAPSHSAELADTANTIFKEIHAATGIGGRMMRRDDSSGTWMEIYEHVADQAAFEAALAQAVARSGFDKLLAGDTKRHVERFIVEPR
jgi:hypothetical protein